MTMEYEQFVGFAQPMKHFRKYEDTVTQLDFLSRTKDKKKKSESFSFPVCGLFEDSDFDCYYM